MTYAVVRIRGHVNVRGEVSDTLGYLRLRRVNHCVFLRKSASVEGMLQHAKDYITWGEVDQTVVAMILVRRARIEGDRPINDAFVKANSPFPSMNSLAKAIAANEATLSDVKGLTPVIRLPPARGGFGGIKRAYREGGALGYRGKEINALLLRMLGTEAV